MRPRRGGGHAKPPLAWSAPRFPDVARIRDRSSVAQWPGVMKQGDERSGGDSVRRVWERLFACRARAIYFLVRALVFLLPGLEAKLMLAQAAGDFAWHNHIGRYADPKLESYLISRVARRIGTIPRPGARRCETLHILSRPYSTGGHTRVVERFAAYPSLGKSAVLVTRGHDTESLTGLEKVGVEIWTLDRRQEAVRQIKEIAGAVLAAGTVILHIHPDDIRTTVAVGAARTIREDLTVALYNHADHNFSYGFSVVDKVLEVSWLGWLRAEQRGTAGKRAFVGVPLAEPAPRSAPRTTPGKVVIGSVGAARKYVPDETASFFTILERLLAIPGVVLEVVGVDETSSRAWADHRGRYGSRLRLTPSVPAWDLAHVLSGWDVYLDSVPVPGGTAFPQGFSACGVALALQSPIGGFTPADCLRSETVDEIVEVAREYCEDPERCRERFNGVRSQTIAFHSDAATEMRLGQALSPGSGDPPPFPKPDYIDVDYWRKRYRRERRIRGHFVDSLPRSLRPVFRVLASSARPRAEGLGL